MLAPPLLKKGDTVAITAPAGKITLNEIHHAIDVLEDWGLKVMLGKTIGTSHFKYADTDENRIKDVQYFLDSDNVKAIFFARGGYGSIRIIDRLDFSKLQNKPKWIVGYSDITIFHAYLNFVLDIPSIHGPMPKTFNDEESNNYLKSLLFKGEVSYKFSDAKFIKEGKTHSKIIGGNLAMVHSNLGSKSDILPHW
jgi:muramoyltetrapeptide carboxypeptidase